MCVLGLQTLRNLLEGTLHSDLEDAPLIHQAWVAATGHTAEHCRDTEAWDVHGCVRTEARDTCSKGVDKQTEETPQRIYSNFFS